MKKKHIVLIIFCSVALSFLVNIFFGRMLTAQVSTLPFLNRWKLLSPQAPIVITNRETVRLSDSGDMLQAVNAAKPRLAAVVFARNNSVVLAGAAANITSDGMFVTASSTFAAAGQAYSVVLQDGTIGKISALTLDMQTGLAYFKASVHDIPTAVFGNSKGLVPGEKILFLAPSTENFNTRFSASFVTQAQNDIAGQTFDSDKPARAFGFQAAGILVPGAAAVNLKGDLLGIWNGTGLIASDVLRQGVNALLSNNGIISHPAFGFSYSYVTQTESSITGQPVGAKITTAGKAKAQGLFENDIITAVGGVAIDENSLLEEALERYKPGDEVVITLQRNKQPVNLTLRAQ